MLTDHNTTRKNVKQDKTRKHKTGQDKKQRKARHTRQEHKVVLKEERF